MEGYIAIHRKIQHWEWYQNANTMRVFFHLLLNARHKDGYYQGHALKRGDVFTSPYKIGVALGLKVDAKRKQCPSVKTAFKHLQDTGEITTKGYNKHTIVSICNYGDYQNPNVAEGSTDELINNYQDDQQRANKKPTDSKQITTFNNVDNVNKGKKEKRSKARGSLEELKAYALELELPEADGEFLFNSWEAGGWMRGGQPIKDWKAAMRTWKTAGWLPSQKGADGGGSAGEGSKSRFRHL